MTSLKRSLSDEALDGLSSTQQLQRKRVRVAEPAEVSYVNGDEESQFQATGEGEHDSSSDGEEDRLRQERYELQHSQAIHTKLKQLGDNSPNDNGILESVECVNFMCHKHFSVELGPLINFIVGKNGSGKSAILTAITLCLGGKASVTNRGQSLKKFIKEGADSATIIVRIKNGGDGAYRQNDYGDVITVERHFARNGSSGFKLKNSRGRIMSTKKADLDDIIDYYVLQIDNPMNVLSQDLARQFLSASTPSDKYKFFVKGVQLEQLDQDYRLMEESVNQNASKLQAYEEELKVVRKEHKEAVDLQKKLDRHMHLKDQINETRKLMAWAIVENQQQAVDDINAEVDEIAERLVRTEDDINHSDQLLQRTEQRLEEQEKERAEAVVALEAYNDARSEISRRVQEANSERQNQLAENRSIREAIKQLENSIEKLDRSIEEEKDRLRELDNGRSTRLQQEIEEKQKLAKELTVQLKDAQETMRELREEVLKAQRVADEKKQPLSMQQNEVDQAETRLNHLRRNKDQQRNGFSPRMPDLLRAIDREVGSFSMRPVGPLGNHVRLMKPKWSSILEQTFGGALSSFVVTSKRDMNILQKIMQRVQCSCPIFIASDTSPLDTSAHEPDQEYDNILRVLEIDSEIVKRQLVINNGIEQTLLIEDLEEASKVMFDRQRPRNVKRCFAIDRHNPRRGYALTYNRSGGPGQSPIPAFQGQTRMKTDHESQIRIQQEMVNTLRNELRQLEEERRTAVTHAKRCQEALNRQQREISNLRVKHQSTEDRISELQDEVANDAVRAGRLTQLQENRQNNLDEQASHKSSLEDGFVALEEKTQKLRAVRAELAAKDAEKADIHKRLTDCETAVSKHQSKRAQVLSSKNKLHDRLTQYQAMKATKEHERETATQILETCNTKALGLSERLPVPEGETPDTLNQKREKLTADYNQAMRRMGLSPEEVAARTAATEAKLVRVEKQFRDFAQTHQKLTQALNERFNRWKLFRSYITARAKIQFTYLLSERGFRGKTVVDHNNKLLDIKVEPDITTDGAGREAKTLSGGEKSFSQICLLLSLWEAMGSPIRCLDEFDVYMDSVNRRLSIELLMTAARRSVGKQFIFITPGSRADIRTAPDVKVNELAEPQRGQSRLPFGTGQ